jgi:hypothetical protein
MIKNRKVMLEDRQIVLTFADKETIDYVKLVCRRKGTSLESYIVGNLEWDDKLECISFSGKGLMINWRMCNRCDYSDRCPDAKKKETKRKKR